MSVFGDISQRITNIVSRPNPKADVQIANAGAHLGPGAVEAMRAARSVVTEQGKTPVTRQRRPKDLDEHEEPLDADTFNELTPLIVRVTRSFLSTAEKVRLIREVESEYAVMDMAERPFFVRRMIRLVGELEGDLAPEERNLADDREEVLEAVRAERRPAGAG